MTEADVFRALLLVAFGLACWWVLKLSWRKIVYCNFRGHAVDRSALTGGETKCVRCGFPLLVYADPDDPKQLMVTDVW